MRLNTSNLGDAGAEREGQLLLAPLRRGDVRHHQPPPPVHRQPVQRQTVILQVRQLRFRRVCRVLLTRVYGMRHAALPLADALAALLLLLLVMLRLRRGGGAVLPPAPAAALPPPLVGRRPGASATALRSFCRRWLLDRVGQQEHLQELSEDLA